MPSEPVRPEPWTIGSVIAERYELLEHVGSGGMGLVYRVKDMKTGRVRALKTIRNDLDPETKSLVIRFLKSEADALSRLENDFVVRIFDASIADCEERPFVVMEFLPGQDLHHILDKRGALPLVTTMSLLWQLACALRAIHEQGIVHRDLKPANLYLKTRDDGSFELKVLDFSISRLLDRVGERKTTVVVGTRGFMAPEQAAGYDVDHRADIYSLGQVARHLLRSELAGSSDSPAGTQRARAFQAWHARATAYQREDRFQTATSAVETLAQELGVSLPTDPRLGDGEPAPAVATISGVRPIWLRRAVAAVVAVALLGVFAWLLPGRRPAPSAMGDLKSAQPAPRPASNPAVPLGALQPNRSPSARPPAAEPSTTPRNKASSIKSGKPLSPSAEPRVSTATETDTPRPRRPSDTF